MEPYPTQIPEPYSIEVNQKFVYNKDALTSYMENGQIGMLSLKKFA